MNKLKRIKNLSFSAHALMPWVCFRSSGESLVPSLWNGTQWQQVRLDALPQPTLFTRYIRLIADKDTCFRNRSFPVDMIDAKHLDEAIALDIQLWSPWGGASGYFSWPVLDGDHWRVAIWIWDAGREKDFSQSILAASGILLTHVMPESVWYIISSAALTGAPALFFRPVQGRLDCVFIDELGVPRLIASVSSAVEGERFRRSIRSSMDTMRAILLQDGDAGVESCVNERVAWVLQGGQADSVDLLKQHPPAGRTLSHAKLLGIKDWYDPFKWRKPLAALLLFWVLWLAGSSVIVWHRNDIVKIELQQVRASAKSVILLRDHVRNMHNTLEVINRLRQRQSRELNFLAGLSNKLPVTAYLLSVVDDGVQVSIQGRAKNAASIGAALDGLPSINHIAYVGNIRPVLGSDLESFHLRLHFAGAKE